MSPHKKKATECTSSREDNHIGDGNSPERPGRVQNNAGVLAEGQSSERGAWEKGQVGETGTAGVRVSTSVKQPKKQRVPEAGMRKTTVFEQGRRRRHGKKARGAGPSRSARNVKALEGRQHGAASKERGAQGAKVSA